MSLSSPHRVRRYVDIILLMFLTACRNTTHSAPRRPRRRSHSRLAVLVQQHTPFSKHRKAGRKKAGDEVIKHPRLSAAHLFATICKNATVPVTATRLQRTLSLVLADADAVVPVPHVAEGGREGTHHALGYLARWLVDSP